MIKTDRQRRAAYRQGSRVRFFALLALAFAVTSGAPVAMGEGLIRELKIGGLYHDAPHLWSGFQLEPASADINIEVLFGPHVQLLWGTLRPALGTSINTRGGTSKGYLDARWEVEAASGIFFALGVGVAVHDGTVGPTNPNLKALGSRVLFHFPAELGWRWDGHNSLSIYFEHISNGYTQDHNEGLDSIGLRYGYRF